jgi:hypothetical protein
MRLPEALIPFNCQTREEPTGFLRDYWMARYHGFIQAPSTSKPELISVNPSKYGHIVAKPYDGPGRPVLY